MSERRRDFLLALVLAVLALVVRLVYLQQAQRVPLFAVPISDSQAYLEWAERIAAGDLSGRSIGVFYQAPLYPYLLAAERSLGLASLAAHRVVQALAAALACVLLFVAGRRLAGSRGGGPWVGFAAGLLLALHAPGIFYEGSIQKESLAGLAVSALLAALVWAAEQNGEGRARRWLVAGAALGGLVLIRENALLLAPLLAMWVLWRGGWGRPARAAVAGAACLLGGLGVVLAPVALRNRVVGGELVLTTAQAGPNFYIGNHAGATGSYVPLSAGRSDTPLERADAVALAERALGRKLSAREVSRYWLGRGLDFVRSEPVAWLRLLGTKTAMTLGAFELPDAEDYLLYRERVPLLGVLGRVFHFGLVLPLAAAGLVLAWPRRRELAPVVLVLVGLAAGPVLFYVFGRYRLPLVAPLCLLAALALAEARAAPRRRVLAALVAFVVMGLWANRPPPAAWMAGAGMGELNLGVALARQGRLEEAVEAYRRALARTPGLVEGHANLGSTLLFLGRPAEGLAHLERAAQLQPEDAEIRQQLETARALTAPR